MADTWYAVYFTRDWVPGTHWHDTLLPDVPPNEPFRHGAHKVPKDHSDRKQHWKTGELFAVGTFVEPKKLKQQGMKEVVITTGLREDGLGPDFENYIWNTKTLQFDKR